MLREAEGGLKATTDKTVTTLLSLYLHSFLLLSVSFRQSHVFSLQAMLKTISAHFRHSGPKAEL